jgi:hypothetical protein
MALGLSHPIKTSQNGHRTVVCLIALSQFYRSLTLTAVDVSYSQRLPSDWHVTVTIQPHSKVRQGWYAEFGETPRKNATG